VVYYYTYGSVLAALSRPKDNHCPDAREMFTELRASFSEDTTIMKIVRDGEAICQSIGQPSPTPETSTPAASASPTP
jgi:hypothetical protein